MENWLISTDATFFFKCIRVVTVDFIQRSLNEVERWKSMIL